MRLRALNTLCLRSWVARLARLVTSFAHEVGAGGVVSSVAWVAVVAARGLVLVIIGHQVLLEAVSAPARCAVLAVGFLLAATAGLTRPLAVELGHELGAGDTVHDEGLVAIEVGLDHEAQTRVRSVVGRVEHLVQDDLHWLLVVVFPNALDRDKAFVDVDDTAALIELDTIKFHVTGRLLLQHDLIR